jgi:hypothetical protein
MYNTFSMLKSIAVQLKTLIKPLVILLIIVFSIGFAAPVFSQFYLLNSPSAIELAKPDFKKHQTEDLSYAYITLDGRNLFQVAVQKSTASDSIEAQNPIQKRVQAIEKTLDRIIAIGFEPDSLSVNIKSLNNQTVIIAQDNQQLSQQVIFNGNSAGCSTGSTTHSRFS